MSACTREGRREKGDKGSRERFYVRWKRNLSREREKRNEKLLKRGRERERE